MKQINCWTENQESIVLEEVKKSPHNLRTAFFNASVKMKGERSVNAISNRWYSIISKKVNSTSDVAFAIFSRNRYGVNRKNLVNKASVRMNRSIWNNIIKYILNVVR